MLVEVDAIDPDGSLFGKKGKKGKVKLTEKQKKFVDVKMENKKNGIIISDSEAYRQAYNKTEPGHKLGGACMTATSKNLQVQAYKLSYQAKLHELGPEWYKEQIKEGVEHEQGKGKEPLLRLMANTLELVGANTSQESPQVANYMQFNSDKLNMYKM